MSFNFQQLPASPPLSNIDRNLVNSDSSTYSADFTSNVNPATVNSNVLPEPTSNVQAIKGGAKINRAKINKISRKYKMKRSRKSFIKRTKRRLRSKYAKKSRARTLARKGGAWRKSRKQRGGMPNYPAGHTQYLNNVPMTQTYSVGSQLSSSESALANPPPITTLCNNGSCVDNYNHNQNFGFPSRGSF